MLVNKKILEAISMPSLQYYIFKKGWNVIGSISDKALIFGKEGCSQELFLPMRKTLGDYEYLLSTCIDELCEAEDIPRMRFFDEIFPCWTRFPNSVTYHRKFLAFEGIDGAGKTTQIKYLAENLMAKGHEVVCTREPSYCLNHENAYAELCFLNAARIENLEKTILPALLRGAWVLCDRYLASTLAYQGAGLGIDDGVIWTVHSAVCGGHMPGYTMILDIDYDSADNRIMRRNLEKTLVGLHIPLEIRGSDPRETREFQEKVRARFIDLARELPEFYSIINSDNTADEVARQVYKNFMLYTQSSPR